jgi:hypothetical protein
MTTISHRRLVWQRVVILIAGIGLLTVIPAMILLSMRPYL